jgi:hypothetical protein
MSLLTLFLKRGGRTEIQRVVDGKTGAIVLDALIKEDYSADAEPTTHPVEDGADITDHVILRPRTLSIEGIVTETPLGGFVDSLVNAGIQTVTSSIGQAISKRVGGGAFGAAATSRVSGLAGKTLSGLIKGPTDNRLNGVLQELRAVRDSRQPVTIVTGLTQYDSFILRSFTVSRDQTTGKSIRVSLSFQELLKATSKTVRVPVPKVKSAVSKVERGRQGTTELTSTSEKGKRASIAYTTIFGGG